MSYEENEFSHILYEAKMYLRTYRFTTGNQMFTNLVRVNHAVHLRNLAYFFGEKKHHNNWHYSDFVADSKMIKPIPGESYGQIMKYCNGAVDHLGPDRVSETYKAETEISENEAFPILVARIQELLRALSEGVMPGYEMKWRHFYIQDLAKEVYELCEINALGGGCVLSGYCQMYLFDFLGEDEDGLPIRFFKQPGKC